MLARPHSPPCQTGRSDLFRSTETVKTQYLANDSTIFRAPTSWYRATLPDAASQVVLMFKASTDGENCHPSRSQMCR